MGIELADLSELLGRARGGTVEPPVPMDLLLDRDIDPDPRPAGRAEGIDRERLDAAIAGAQAALLAEQRPRGEWCFELESNVQIEAQWILTLHYLGLGEREGERQRKLVERIRATQQRDGGWKLQDDAASDLSITVQAYFAAKLAGSKPHEPWLEHARAFILREGGAERSSVITKIYLALFDQYPWRCIPAMPVAVMLMPRGTAFNIYEQAYWARTCVVPLLVLYHQKRIFTPPPSAAIDELFHTPKDGLTPALEESVPALSWRNFFHQADRALKAFERAFAPSRFRFGYRQKALKAAERWLLDHQDQDGGWGGIFPAMTHSVMALHALGYPTDDGPVAKGLSAIRDLEIEEQGAIRVQPCVSPVWDTGWAVIALAKAGLDRDHPAMRRATDWLYSMQILKPGDWSQKCPDVPPGGWAFQYFNDFYPDTDDSSVVLMALLNSHYRDDPGKRLAFDRGIQWLLGLQNQDGGWGAFERGVDNEIYNEIRFNDAKNMLDPSTVDVTGRCVEVLAKLGYPRTHKALRRAVRFILRGQERDGSFWGRWGVNYVYGTWSALCALAAAKVPLHHPAIERAARWLESVQRPDGGFGESCTSYATKEPTPNRSCASQTAWGVMAFLAAGKASSEGCRRAVTWLLDHIDHDGSFREDNFTGTGFPNVFYLRYHGYARYFPLLALARYREALVG